MNITFIMPAVAANKKGDDYVKSWLMEPLGLAVLSALTPPDINRIFFDDRLEEINYELSTNLVAINIETYTAKRAYQIADKYRKRNIPVIFGGFHATLIPDEILERGDSVLVGEAEELWSIVIEDLKKNKLKKKYFQTKRPKLTNIKADRSI